MTPADLLGEARELMARTDSATAGIWPRTSALLIRQALEQAVRSRWAALPDTAGLASASMRSQLTCLPYYLDVKLAGQVAYVWAALSRACHYHPYELAPIAAELTGWIGDVERLITQVQRAAATFPKWGYDASLRPEH
jgi:hypothetical protein